MTDLRIDIDRLIERLAALAEIGAIDGTEGCARLALTNEDRAGRDLVVSVYRILVGSKGVSVPASRVAKYKTLCQPLAVGFALWPWFAVDHRWLWNGLLWVAVGLALVSGWNYLAASRGQRVSDAV